MQPDWRRCGVGSGLARRIAGLIPYPIYDVVSRRVDWLMCVNSSARAGWEPCSNLRTGPGGRTGQDHSRSGRALPSRDLPRRAASPCVLADPPPVLEISKHRHRMARQRGTAPTDELSSPPSRDEPLHLPFRRAGRDRWRASSSARMLHLHVSG